MNSIEVEEELARELSDHVGARVCRGTIAGKLAFREAAMDVLGCSAAEAELVVGDLVARRLLVFVEIDERGPTRGRGS